MTEEADYEVGYCRPPLHSRFKKGQPSSNPRGRGKAIGIDVCAFFDKDVVATVDGSSTKISAFQLGLTNMAAKAVKGDLKAARYFLELCDEAGLLSGVPDQDTDSSLLIIPKDYDHDEWNANLDALGSPPWPGEHDGLPRLTPERFVYGRSRR